MNPIQNGIEARLLTHNLRFSHLLFSFMTCGRHVRKEGSDREPPSFYHGRQRRLFAAAGLWHLSEEEEHLQPLLLPPQGEDLGGILSLPQTGQKSPPHHQIQQSFLLRVRESQRP